MRKNLIQWRTHKDGNEVVDPNFIMACGFEGFSKEEVEAEIQDFLTSPDNPNGVRTIVKVFERKRDNHRLIIWDDGDAKLMEPENPCWPFMDVGRSAISLSYGDHWFIFEDDKINLELVTKIRETMRDANIRRDWETKLNRVHPNQNIWLLDAESQKELLAKSSEELMSESHIKVARLAGELSDERQVAFEEEKDTIEHGESLPECGYDYAAAIEVSKNLIESQFGRGRRKVDGTSMKFRLGRMYNCETAEYLIAPGLNFGPEAWWQKHRQYYRGGGEGWKATPQEVVKKLANAWKDNVVGAYSNDVIVRQYDAWLDLKPKLKIGILNKATGKMVEKTLELERRTVNPKTGEEYTHTHYCMNGYRVPKARWEVALKHWLNVEIPDWEFNGFLKQMGKYTVEMLDLPNTIKEVSFSIPSLTNRYGETEKFNVKFMHRLNEGYWNIYCADLMSGKMKADHETVRKFLGKLRNSYNGMAEMVESFKDMGVTDKDFMQAMQVRAYRREMREKSSEDLLKDVASQFSDRVTYHQKEQCVLVRGKLATYIVDINEKNAHGQVTVKKAVKDESEGIGYKKGAWVCIVEDAKHDTGIAYDKVVARVLLLMNDEEMAGKVGTLGR